MNYIPTFENFNDLVFKFNEGLIKTEPLHKTVDIINRELRLARLKYRITDIDISNNTFKFVIDDYNYNDVIIIKLGCIDSIITNQCGYFPSSVSIEYVSHFYRNDETLKWCDDMYMNLAKKVDDISRITIKFESKFDECLTQIPSEMYHITNDSYVDKILRNGLVPKSKNKLSSHPDRIYLCTSIDDCKSLEGRMYMQDSFNMMGLNLNKNNNKKLKYTILKIDMSDFSGKIYKDPNYKDTGFYITTNIKPDKISIV